MSYNFILCFLPLSQTKYLFLSQKEFKHKKLRFFLQCNLEQELKPILYDIYQKNIHMEVTDHDITQQGFLKGMVSSIHDHNTIDLPPIREEQNGDVISLH